MPDSKKNPYAWPSLEDQLRAARAVRGSALDKLIRDHQDFEILRPDEAGDKLELPPWLRVYWRKLHPDAKYTGSGDSYPRHLANLYEWMVDHQDLKPPKPDVVDPADPRGASPYAPKGDKKDKKGGPHGD